MRAIRIAHRWSAGHAATLVVVRATGQPGSDHNLTIDVLRCDLDGGHEFGVNGSYTHERRCPDHDGGRPGLAFEAPVIDLTGRVLPRTAHAVMAVRA